MVSLNTSLSRLRGQMGPIAFGDAEDWCVLRLDRDDQTLEVYWSEPNAPYRLTSASQNDPGGGAYRGWGGHAEMNLIRDFQNVLTSHGRVPDLVEIFISRSPCARSPLFTVGGQQYPVGCGKKLLKLVELNPRVNVWKVVYDEVFSGSRTAVVPDVAAQAQAEHMIRLLNRHPRVEALLWAEYSAR